MVQLNQKSTMRSKHVAQAKVQVEDPDHLVDAENEVQIHDKDPNEEEPEGELELSEGYDRVEPKRKRQQGPTRLKGISKDPNTRVRVEFTNIGEPTSKGSVKLSSYVGALVREHVPITVDCWTKIGEEVWTHLWKSVEVKSVKLISFNRYWLWIKYFVIECRQGLN